MNKNIKYILLNLSANQIKELYKNPIEIIPSPGAGGKIIINHDGSIFVDGYNEKLIKIIDDGS